MGNAHLHPNRLEGLGVDVDNFGGYLTTGYFFNKQGTPFKCYKCAGRIHTAFEPERSIGIKAVALGCNPYGNRVEISAFNEDIAGFISNSRMQSAKHTANGN